MQNRKLKPKFKPLSTVKPLTPKVRRLNNGIPLYMITGAKQDVIVIEFLLPAGNIYEKKRLVSKFTAKMLMEGTKGHSSSEISDLFNYYGSKFSVSSGSDYAYMRLQVLNAHLQNVLPMAAEILTQPIFPLQELNLLRKKEMESFLISQKSNDFIASKNFSRILFGGKHPYGYYQSEEDYRKIYREDLLEFFHDFYNLSKCKILVSGKIPEGFADIMNKHVGNIHVSKERLKSPNILLDKAPKRILHIGKEESTQSSLEMGHLTIGPEDRDYQKLLLLNLILGGAGFFNSRLMKKIRAKNGLTYGISSHINSHKFAGQWSIKSEINARSTKFAVKEIKSEILDLHDNLISPGELQTAKNYFLNRFANDFDGPFKQHKKLAFSLKFGLDHVRWYEGLFETINSATSDDIQMLAQKHFRLNDLVEVAIGKI